MSKEILDNNWDWDDHSEDLNNPIDEDGESAPVVMLKTFNTEQQAYIYAAVLQNEGIEAQVVSTITSVMTPFDYGNVRLYVAAAQSQDAQNIIKRLDAENALKEKPKLSSTAILMIIIAALIVFGGLIAFLRAHFLSQIMGN